MRVVSGFIVREIAGEIVAVPTGEAARSLSGIITLNGCGRYLFEKLQTDQTPESLVDALLEEYDTDRQRAEKDVDAFLSLLQRYGFLENA